uniref:USP domain-containing protein n=1 Tax=Steinernema glaseri TaxID=37863 RepID=A0A1I8AEV1_9BILA
DLCSCAPVGRHQEEELNVLHLDLRHSVDKRLKFTEAMEKTQKPPVADCRRCCKPRQRTVRYAFPEEQTHLLVAIDQPTPPVDLDGMNKKGIVFFGYTWRPVAAIEHVADGPHYISWIAQPTTWFVQDDDATPTTKRQMLLCLKGYTLIVFKKVDVYKPRKKR